MPTREEMIAALRRGGPKQPSRDQMIAALRGDSGDSKSLVPQSVRDEFERGDLLGPGIRVADAPGGFVRTGLANVAGLVSGKGNIVTEEDLAKTAWGEAPKTEEYLKRLGVPEMGSADIPGLGKTTGREALGFVGDTVTSPVGRMSKIFGLSGDAEAAGVKIAEKAAKAAKPGLLTEADVALGLLGEMATHDPVAAAKYMAIKKLYDLGKTEEAGQLLQKVGQSGLLDSAARRGVINVGKEKE